MEYHDDIGHAERSADQPADRVARPCTRRPPPHAPMAHDVQRAMQDRNKCACTNNCYSNETTNSTANSDIIHVCTDTNEFASGNYTTPTPPNSTVCVISAGDTVPPATANNDGHVPSRHAHSEQDDNPTGSAEETAEAGEEEAATDGSTDCMATVNLQTQQQDRELANIIDYLKNDNLPEDSKIARRIVLTKDQFAICENYCTIEVQTDGKTIVRVSK